MSEPDSVANRDPRAEKPSRFGGNLLGVVILILAFAASTIVSVINTLRIERPDETVIRISHWQLEKGYREAMQMVIDEYQKLNPGVRIEQMGVTERVYGQWINTHLISGTAPDICEIGQSSVLSKDEYTVKYFLPLSDYITQPNPYNADNDLKNTPWKETLADGMRGGFREGLQEYYAIPTTLISIRMYYNKDLLRETTGSDEAPKTFGQWMAQCEKIKEYAEKKKSRLLPIVNCYSMGLIQGNYEVAYTSKFERDLDLDLTGDVTPLESYIGYRTKKVSLRDPEMQALFKTLKLIGDQMQRGFSSVDRQQAQFKFVNGQAVFLFSGSWDASGNVNQAKASGFDVGIAEFPLPAPGEEFGNLVRGRANEASQTGSGPYGVFKGGKNIDRSLDFLKFLTSRRGNELLNQKSEWPPLTLGAKPSELMKPFAPNPRGYNAKVQLSYGTRVQAVVNGKLLNYLQGDEPFESYEKAFETVIVDPNQGGDWAWWFEYDTRRRDVRSKERGLAQQDVMALVNPEKADEKRYQRSLYQQLTRNNAMDYLWLFRQYRDAAPEKAWADFQPVFP